MFGMGFTEILLIAIVAILFLGPEKLPDAMVSIAKFIKGVKRAVSDAKNSLEEEIKISDLKEEALGYKKQLDEASSELQSFKNIGINPIDEINEAISSASDTLSGIDGDNSTQTVTQVEPKKESVTFKKKKKEKQKSNSKGGEA
ncbi:Twin-arginine translocation protein TatB [hydrothermal vent metagenome]|uniref:Twin-arginine translocation protein TatB n=1 Tax=hydrothermal vent metagenome TaxID=652676 RepID=A0A1W1BQG7_9ZZZZ